VYYCRTSAHAPPVPAGLRVAIHKSSGSSGEGVTPVSAATPLSYIDLAKLNAAPGCRDAKRVRATGDFAAEE
jgi:hypothetical protein